MRCEYPPRSPFSAPPASRNNLEIAQALIIKLVPPVASRNFLNRARLWKTDRDCRCDDHTRWVVDVERFRAKMVGPTARRHSDRAWKFLVLFSHRHMHHSQRCLEFASIALLDFPA